MNTTKISDREFSWRFIKKCICSKTPTPKWAYRVMGQVLVDKENYRKFWGYCPKMLADINPFKM